MEFIFVVRLLYQTVSSRCMDPARWHTEYGYPRNICLMKLLNHTCMSQSCPTVTRSNFSLLHAWVIFGYNSVMGYAVRVYSCFRVCLPTPGVSTRCESLGSRRGIMSLPASCARRLPPRTCSMLRMRRGRSFLHSTLKTGKGTVPSVLLACDSIFFLSPSLLGLGL